MPVSNKRLAEIDAIHDDGIDTSDIPEMDEAFFVIAKLILPPSDAVVTFPPRVDEDALD